MTTRSIKSKMMMAGVRTKRLQKDKESQTKTTRKKNTVVVRASSMVFFLLFSSQDFSVHAGFFFCLRALEGGFGGQSSVKSGRPGKKEEKNVTRSG